MASRWLLLALAVSWLIGAGLVVVIGTALGDALSRESALVVENERLARENNGLTADVNALKEFLKRRRDPAPPTLSVPVDPVHLDLLVSGYGKEIPEPRRATEDS